MASSNPVLRESRFEQYATMEQGDSLARMTVAGSINKTIILLVILTVSSLLSWNVFLHSNPETAVSGLLTANMISWIGTLILALIMCFKPQTCPYLSPVYAIVEGISLGVLSGLFAMLYSGIVIQAVFFTFGTLFLMLTLYRLRIIKVTEKLKAVIMACTVGVLFFYLAIMLFNIVSHLAGWSLALPSFGSPVSILISVVVVGIAAFNLLLDFDTIESGANMGLPKYMEWYCAFGLMVTLIWLYLEILRLLAKTRER